MSFQAVDKDPLDRFRRSEKLAQIRAVVLFRVGRTAIEDDYRRRHPIAKPPKTLIDGAGSTHAKCFRLRDAPSGDTKLS